MTTPALVAAATTSRQSRQAAGSAAGNAGVVIGQHCHRHVGAEPRLGTANLTRARDTCISFIGASSEWQRHSLERRHTPEWARQDVDCCLEAIVVSTRYDEECCLEASIVSTRYDEGLSARVGCETAHPHRPHLCKIVSVGRDSTRSLRNPIAPMTRWDTGTCLPGAGGMTATTWQKGAVHAAAKARSMQTGCCRRQSSTTRHDLQ